MAKAIITAALAARDASLDWAKLTGRRDSYLVPTPPAIVERPDATRRQVADGVVTLDSASADSEGADVERSAASAVPLIDPTPEPEVHEPVRFSLARPLREQSPSARVVSVPDVHGLPLRVAVRELHRSGFRVQLVASGGGVTSPPAGAPAQTGALVRLARP